MRGTEKHTHTDQTLVWFVLRPCPRATLVESSEQQRETAGTAGFLGLRKKS